MEKYNDDNKEIKIIKRFFFIIAFVLLTIIIANLVWTIHNEYEQIQHSAEEVAMAIYEQNIDVMSSISSYGGVFVPITKVNSPNPFLTNFDDRELTAITEKKITLLHPLFKVHTSKKPGEISKATSWFASLTPLESEHKADTWEEKAFKYFETNSKLSYSSIEKIGDEKYLRFIQKILIQKSCLKCHSQQGYKEGDVCGGLSIKIPMNDEYEIAKKEIINDLIVHGFFCVIFLLLIIFGYRKLKTEIINRHKSHQLLNENQLNLNIQYEKLQKAKKNLEESSNTIKLQNMELMELNATKDKFFSIIAHDLRTPFMSILGLSELLVKNIEKYEKEKILEFSKHINNSAKITFDLLENLLEWARLQRNFINPNFQNHNLHMITKNICLLLNDMAQRKNIIIQNNINSDINSNCDNVMTNTVFRNLISNAIKFTNSNGIVSIFANQKDTYIEIQIHDTGIGIPTDKINNLFKIDKDNSTIGTANESGTGLGLILCKELVEKQGGKIWIESEVNKGTSFYFTVPNMKKTKKINFKQNKNKKR